MGLAQTTQPAGSQADLAASEFRATQAMASGQLWVIIARRPCILAVVRDRKLEAAAKDGPVKCQ